MANTRIPTRILELPWLAEGLAALGLIFSAWQMAGFALTQESVLDEGAYVYKGLLFLSGQYTPYQPGGPWTNHTPLAFLIPGVFQTMFEPGLRTARYAAIFFALLMLLGMWILGRRLGNRWWAAAAVWATALNPALLKTYSTAVTQGLVTCMLVWMLVLTLGEKRPAWQLALGAALAGAMIMTRINMLPALPLLVMYILWQYGWKSGLLAALAGSAVVIGLHVVYWPDILQVWTRLPKWMTPFLNEWRLPPGYKQSWQPEASAGARLLSLFLSLRFNFVTMVGVLAALLLWPRRSTWKKDADFKAAVFLATLFISLLLTHLWAALGKQYCTFCLAGYISFFAELGMLLVILSAACWSRRLSPWTQAVILLVILVLSAGIGYGAFEQLGERLVNLSVPRLLIGDFQPGSAPLGAILTNKFGLEAQTLRRLLPPIFGLAFGALVVIVALGIAIAARRAGTRPSGATPAAWGFIALVIFLASGALLTPSLVLAGGYATYDCPGDVIASNEAAGRHLATIIPAGSQVYWKGTLSAAPLLHAPDLRIYPAQINDGYSMLASGEDPEIITRFGRWNEALARQWAGEADYLVIEERQFRGWIRELVRGGGYEELSPAPPAAACRADSAMRIFRRAP